MRQLSTLQFGRSKSKCRRNLPSMVRYTFAPPAQMNVVRESSLDGSSAVRIVDRPSIGMSTGEARGYNGYLERFFNHKMCVLKMLFPAMMVAGALGSLIVNVIEKGNWAVSLQWFGAAMLYTALLARNIGG